MKKTGFCIIMFLSALCLFPDTREVRRFGLFIGANDGGRGREQLLYADDDALSMSMTMEEVGGISSNDSIMLVNPKRAEILEALHHLSEQIDEAEYQARRTEIMFYYSGHSDANGFLLSDGSIPYKDIRDKLDQSGADVIIAVLDSCSSGAITRTKGGQRRSPLLIDESSAMEGHAYLTSSSDTEVSQESDQIEASFFTHYLVTGLRGAADNTGDGRVSLNELYEHTFQETLSRTESTMGGSQHPAYEIQLAGTGDLVLTDLTNPDSALQISEELTGRFSIRNSRGKLIAEFSKYEPDTLKLALPAGIYVVNRDNGKEVGSAEIELGTNTLFYLTEEDLSLLSAEDTRFRGGEIEYDEVSLALSLGFGLTSFPTLQENSLVRTQFGMGNRAPQFDGIQVSVLYNIADNNSKGVQLSLVNLALSDFKGLQLSLVNYADVMRGTQVGLVNLSESIDGIQVGLVNSSLTVDGPQVGLVNIGGDVDGTQVSLVNYSTTVDGPQIGLVNWGGNSHGTQIGLVNVTGELDGLSIGLVNINPNGMMDLGAWYEGGDTPFAYSYFQSGSDKFYTLLFVGTDLTQSSGSSTNPVSGIHVGYRINWGPMNWDVDGGVTSYTATEGENTNAALSFRTVLGFNVRRLGFFGGVAGVVQSPGSDESTIFDGYSFSPSENGDYTIYGKIIAGVKVNLGS